MAATEIPETAFQQDGEVARRIASVIPFYPYKGLPRFYDINGFLQRPDVRRRSYHLSYFIAPLTRPSLADRAVCPSQIFQEVVDVSAARYRGKIDSIGGFDARGFVLGPPIALALKIPFFMLRKPGKMPNSIGSSAYQVEYGKRDGMCIPRGHPLDKR